jgi:hypothetical protein
MIRQDPERYEGRGEERSRSRCPGAGYGSGRKTVAISQGFPHTAISTNGGSRGKGFESLCGSLSARGRVRFARGAVNGLEGPDRASVLPQSL